MSEEERACDLTMHALLASALGPWGNAEIEDPMQVVLDEIRDLTHATATVLGPSGAANVQLKMLTRRVELAVELYERMREEKLVERYGYKAYDLVEILNRALRRKRGETELPPTASDLIVEMMRDAVNTNAREDRSSPVHGSVGRPRQRGTRPRRARDE